MKVESILCPVDFSPGSQNILTPAAMIARHYGANLHVMHVVSNLRVSESPGLHPLIETLNTQARERLARLIRPLRGAGFPVSSFVKDGDPEHYILQQAIAKDADLVVLATHGRQGMKRLLMGSVTESLLRSLHLPMLIISPRADVSTWRLPPRLLAVSTDGREGASAALRVGAWLTEEFHCALTRIPFEPNPRQTLNRLKTLAPDLFIMNLPRKSLNERAGFGRTAEQVIRGATCPVLAIPPGLFLRPPEAVGAGDQKSAK